MERSTTSSIGTGIFFRGFLSAVVCDSLLIEMPLAAKDSADSSTLLSILAIALSADSITVSVFSKDSPEAISGTGISRTSELGSSRTLSSSLCVFVDDSTRMVTTSAAVSGSNDSTDTTTISCLCSLSTTAMAISSEGWGTTKVSSDSSAVSLSLHSFATPSIGLVTSSSKIAAAVIAILRDESSNTLS